MPFVVYKKSGQTPLDVIENLRLKKRELTNEKLSYAGRLDPMAEGLVLILVGEENSNRKYYEGLKKTYRFSVLFGIATDTYDALGMILHVDLSKDITKNELVFLAQGFIGKRIQNYPPYSSVKVGGKRLYYWSRQGKIDQITIPSKTIYIHSLSLVSCKKQKLSYVIKMFEKNIQRVRGDFRQKETLLKWKQLDREQGSVLVQTATFTIECSSGTYIRQLVNDLGGLLKAPCMTSALQRISVGNYTLRDALFFENNDPSAFSPS